jgi:hypothetical protein
MRARGDYLFNAVLLAVLSVVVAIAGIFYDVNFGLSISGPMAGFSIGGFIFLVSLWNYYVYKSDKNRERRKDARIEALEEEIKRLKNR